MSINLFKNSPGAKKLFFALAGLNILLGGLIIGVFVLASGTAQKKSLEISDLKATSQTNQQALNNYKVLEGTVNSNKDFQAIADRVLPSDKEQSQALADLDNFSRSTGLPIQQISFAQGVSKTGQTLTSPSSLKGVSVIAVVLHSTNAHYDNLLAFLRQIENTQRRMQVTSVAITPNSTTPTLLDRVDLSIDIYLKTGN